jgi:hypothetical protein
VIYRPKTVAAAPEPEQRKPEPAPAPTAPPVHVHAPVTVHTDNRATVDALQRQADQLQQLQGVLAEIADKMTPGVLVVTVTEWTSMGRIKELKITRS